MLNTSVPKYPLFLILFIPLVVKGQNDTLSTVELDTKMKEVTVKASKILMVQDGDTLVYNAELLQMSAGAMLDELINALPEARISPDGLITVKGEPVSELLIEGRDFFHGDPTIALKNLPAFTVKKVKVYRKVPRNAYLTRRDKGKKALKTDPLVMDVRLKPKYQNGIIANVESASGVPTQGKIMYLYLDRLFGLHYNERRSLSGYVGLNNVNDNGHPQSKGLWKERMDEMGEQSHHIGGLDYTYKNPKNNATVSGMFKFDDSRNDQQKTTSTMRFLTDGSLHSLSFNESDERKFSASMTGEVFYPAKSFTVEVRPRITLSKTRILSDSRSATFSEQQDGALQDVLDSIYGLADDEFKSCQNAVNRQSMISESEVCGIDFGIIARSTIEPSSFKQPLSVSLTGNYWSNDITDNRENIIDYGESTQKSINKQQHKLSPSSQSILNLGISYTAWSFFKGERSGTLSLNLQSDFRLDNNENRLYNIDELQRNYQWGAWGELPDEDVLRIVLDDKNSYRKTSTEYNQQLTVNWIYNYSRKIGSTISLPLDIKNRRLRDERTSSDVILTKMNWLANPYFSLRLGGLTLAYSYRTSLPNLEQMAGRTDDSNPLVVNIGNSLLHNSHIHTPSVSFSKRLVKNKASLSLQSEYQIIKDAIKQMFYYDVNTGVTTIQTRNVNGDWRANFRGQYKHAFGKERQWQLSSVIQLTIDNDNQFDRIASVDEASMYAARRTFLSEEAEVTYNRHNWLYSLHGEYKWRHTKSEQERFNNIDYMNIRYGGAIRTPVFHGVSLTSDFYVNTDRGMVNDELNRSYLIWNVNIKYDLSSKWSFQLDGIDLLRQLKSTTLGASAIGWSEVRRNTRPSYILLHATYRFNLLPKERK